MANPKPITADPALAEIVAGGARPIIDLDEALLISLKADAASVNADAVVAEVEVLRLERLAEDHPDDDEGRRSLDRIRKIAADRRRRANGIMRRAGVGSPHELDMDMRLWAAAQLEGAQHDQVRFEERLANLELYAVAEEEIGLQRHPDSPPPLTVGQIKDDAAGGRARVGALTAWLTEHLEADGPLPDEDAGGLNPQRTAAIAKLRRFTGEAPVLPAAAAADATAVADDAAREAAEAEGRRPTPDAGLGPTDPARTDTKGSGSGAPAPPGKKS